MPASLELPTTCTRAPVRPRHDGWTVERQARFLAALELTGSVSAAAAAAGKSRAGAYRFRDRAGGARFGRMWEIALRRRAERRLYDRLTKLTGGIAATTSVILRPRRAEETESGKGDTLRDALQQRQIGQDCRFSPGSGKGADEGEKQPCGTS
jgi:hypothetical protein